MKRKIYNFLNRTLCALFGHPTWITRDYSIECNCGKVYKDLE